MKTRNPKLFCKTFEMRLRVLLCIVMITAMFISISKAHCVETNLAETPVLYGHSDSLEDAWAAAMVSSHQLKASRKSTDAAHETLAGAKATHFPTIAAEGGHFWLDEAPSAVVSLPGLPGLPVALDDKFWTGRVTMTVPLFTSGRISNGVDAANAGWKATLADERRETLDVKLSVADAYVNVLRATQAVKVAASNVASLTSHSQNVSNLFDKGFVAKNDLLTAQVVLANARQSEIKTRNSLDIASASYNRFLGRPLTRMVSLEDLVPAPVSGDVNELTARAYKERPELVALTEKAEALHKEAGSIRASSLPSIGVSGGYNYLQNSFSERDHVWVIGVVGTWNIFDSGLTGHKARAVDDKADAISALRADAIDGVSLQVRQAWLEVDETRLRLDVTKDAVAQAEENLKVVRDRYRTGNGTSTDVLDAETLRVLSRSNHNNAVYDAVMANFRLRRAVGDL
jgi:outer membrane protein TolC